MHSSSLPSISVTELALRLAENDGDNSLQLIDVREPKEAEFAFIQGFKLLPLSAFEQWSNNIILLEASLNSREPPSLQVESFCSGFPYPIDFLL